MHYIISRTKIKSESRSFQIIHLNLAGLKEKVYYGCILLFSVNMVILKANMCLNWALYLLYFVFERPRVEIRFML